MATTLKRRIAALAGAVTLALLLSPAHAAPALDLATPPAGAETWTITSGGRTFGEASRWTTTDGTRWSRDRFSERSYESDIEQQLRFAPDGAIREMVVRGKSPSGDAAETFKTTAGRYAYESTVDHGEGAAKPGAFYVSFGGTTDSLFVLAEALAKAPGHAIDLLPTGRATMTPLTTLQVSHAGRTRTLTAELVSGLDLTPFVIWMDGGHAFATTGALNTLPKGWEEVGPALIKAETAAMARQAPALVARIAPKLNGPVAFTHVRLYDSDAQTFRDDMTVVVEGGRVTGSGPAPAVAIPVGAEVIDGRGKTLLPGLWDSHKHYGDDSAGPLLLSQGITTIRDMGNPPEALQDRRRRIDAGELLGPRIVPLLLLDSPGPQADFAAVLVKTEAEAIAAVHRAKAEGYFGVKIYGSLDPRLIAPIATEAHALGLRVQGHIPRTVRPLDAVQDGYDELTHMNFVMMQAMPDEVVNAVDGLQQRHYGPARLAPGVDFASPQMASYLDELVRRHIVVDPTLVVFEHLWATDKGDLAPALDSFQIALPPQFERHLKDGGLAPLPDLTRTQMRRGFARLVDLTGELHRRGVPIVAGTDGYGLELVRELELYVRAGFTPAEALAAATIVPARVMGLDHETGSLAVGKQADLVLVNGDPGKTLGDLRKVDLVMRDGRLMRARDLRAAAGLAEPAAGAGG